MQKAASSFSNTRRLSIVYLGNKHYTKSEQKSVIGLQFLKATKQIEDEKKAQEKLLCGSAQKNNRKDI